MSAVSLSEANHPIRNLLIWLKHAGARFPQLAVETLANGERTMAARNPIDADDTTLIMPRAAVMCTDKARAWLTTRGFGDTQLNALQTHSLLSAWLLAEQADPASFWQPYLQVLPRRFDHIPLFFPKHLRAPLAGTYAEHLLNQRHIKIEDDYRALCAGDPSFARFTLQQFQWAMTVTASRCFALHQAGQPQVLGLVPLLDLFNHQHQPNQRWCYDNDRDAFTLTSADPIATGETLSISYGRKNDLRFWLHYGFLDSDNTQPRVAVTVTAPAGDPQEVAKNAFIAQLGGPQFVIGEDLNGLEKLRQALRCCLGDWANYAVRHRVRAGEALDPAAEAMVATALTDHCTAALARIPAPLAACQKYGARVDSRLQSVLKIVAGERALWRRLLNATPREVNTVAKETAMPNKSNIDLNQCSLVKVTHQHWPALCRLRVRQDQQRFVPNPIELMRKQVFAKDPSMRVVAIYHDKQAVGLFGVGAGTADEVWFSHFLVDESWQGRGIGRWAFASFLKLLKSSGYTGAVGLNVHRDNTAMIHFYTQQGFTFAPQNNVGDHLGMLLSPGLLAPQAPTQSVGSF